MSTKRSVKRATLAYSGGLAALVGGALTLAVAGRGFELYDIKT